MKKRALGSYRVYIYIIYIYIYGDEILPHLNGGLFHEPGLFRVYRGWGTTQLNGDSNKL